MDRNSQASLMRKRGKERKEGVVDRRTFLKILGGLGVGAAGLSFVPAKARGQKKITVSMWDTEPNPVTRGAMKEIVADFQRLHPDIVINSEGMGWGDMDRKLQAGFDFLTYRKGKTRRWPSTAFAEVTGLEATMEPRAIREGGRNWGQHQRAGQVSFATVVFKRGITAAVTRAASA